MEDNKRTYLGQHFLIDFSTICKIVGSCNVSKSDTVLEFGTGYGYLTKEISKLSKVVYSYEIEEGLYLKAKSYLRNVSNVKIFNEDFFAQDPYEFDFFLSNIPYSRSKEIMKWLSLHEFREGVIMVQKEFSEKLIAIPGERKFSVVSVFSQYCFDIEPLFDVQNESFLPSPHIESNVLRLVRKRNKKEMTEDIIPNLEYLFSHRNKNVVSILNNKDYGNKRIDELDPESLVTISMELNDRKLSRT
ncbi:MAG TPA: rRNA adenine dimethyltransferase family protein [Nitrososphaeraceae archaeon]|nr:rRNA adenine dimethyltransferase family protein [Nitrososphaeraceae archaeon]